MNIDRHLHELELIKMLKTNQEKAKASRLVLIDTLLPIYGETNKKKAPSLLELIDSYPVKSLVNDDKIINSLHFIRILGANAEHGDKIRDNDARIVVKNLEFFLDFLRSKESPEDKIESPEFFTEFETRKIYIDTYLREAGWDILEEKGVMYPGKAGIEIEVSDMPNNAETGFCDYVLYDRSGRPLAVVEAKKTAIDPRKGRHQADLYAESLKKQFGYKPIIYYTNGYEIHLIDGIYPDRQVYAFHALEELELMLQKRNRGKIADMTVDNNIAGRPYQKMALTNLCERLNDNHRRGLIVMATGTGKTRTAIALTDILARNNWIKNVLFLADRTALVNQAEENFVKLLPNMTTCKLSDKTKDARKKDLNARIMFSTYQTMINYIDSEEKIFTTGRFDLIIVDESHRSIFNRYGSIFNYFDGFLVGFTATPRGEVGKNTYDIFECELGEPTFNYPLEDAIKEHYLVGYKVLNRHSRIMTQGIKREELTEEQMEMLDDFYEGEQETPDFNIPANAIFKTIFNEATCRSVLEDLMENGIRINNDEILGKTIIFAYNHRHAQMIVDEFRKMYPKYSANTCQLVDYSVNYADDLVKKYGKDPEFRIAVSVDMLDTGVDVPEILNLVFFKPVRSKIKFIQMIGRGTRLCDDLLAPGRGKKEFLIFDYCDNFEYFQIDRPEAIKSEETISLSQRVFALKTEIVFNLQDDISQSDDFLKSYHSRTVEQLLTSVRDLKENKSRIAIRKNLKYVDKYSQSRTWVALSPVGVHELKTFIAPLIESGIDSDVSALSFDVRMMRVQKAILRGNLGSASNDIKKVREIAQFLLQNKCSIPQVFEKRDDLKEIVDGETWSDIDFKELERLRQSVRELMKYISGQELKLIDIDVTDELIDPEFQPDGTVIDIRTYREKVIDYLTKNGDDETIEKIRNLEPLNQKDADRLKQLLWYDLGSEDEYNENANGKSLAVFIRSLVGINQDAVNEKFGEYLDEHQLNSKQQDFINTIIKYVQKNGDINPDDLVSGPLGNIEWYELFGGNVEPIKYMVKTLHDVIEV